MSAQIGDGWKAVTIADFDDLRAGFARLDESTSVQHHELRVQQSLLLAKVERVLAVLDAQRRWRNAAVLVLATVLTCAGVVLLGAAAVRGGETAVQVPQ